MGEEDLGEAFKLCGVLLRVTGQFVDRLVCLAQPKILFLRGFGEQV